MSNLIIALLFAILAGGLMFVRLCRQTPAQLRRSVFIACLGAVLIFVLILLVLNTLFQ